MFDCQLGNTVDIFECLRGRLEPDTLEMDRLMTPVKTDSGFIFFRKI